MKHLFLEQIFRYEVKNKKVNNLDEYTYNTKLGYCVDKLMEPCVNNTNFIKPRTKKEDIETGEDKKGE